MSVIITLVGIPASGKSTFAEKYRKKGYVIASIDEARKILYGDEFIQGNIGEVLCMVYGIVEDAVKNHKNVVVDATSLTSYECMGILKFHARHIVVCFDTPIDTCLYRNRKRERYVPERIIFQMYERMIYPSEEEGFEKVFFM